jgi:hypothetical protein
MAKQLSEKELEAITANQIRLAKDHDRSEREAPRSKAIDYFLGNMDKWVPPEPNRSKVVSRDVADTIGWMLPGIMRVFTASDKMAEAEPVGREDIEWAKQATDGLNYVFWKDNKGYEVVYNATWNALLVGNGPVKTYYDDTPVYVTSFHSGLSMEQVDFLAAQDDIEVLAGPTPDDGQIEGVDPASGMAVFQPTFEIKIKRKKADGRFIVEAIPPEEFLIDEDAVSTDEAAFTAHWQRKTRSELVAMGYDKAEIWAIPEAGQNDTSEEIAREDYQSHESTDKSMQLVDYFECYMRIDVDGDGEAELVRVCFGGDSNGKLLDWEVWEDEHPFDDIPCSPVPHRWTAQSISDETMDVQDVKTVLSRQLLNNTYWVNNPQTFTTGKIKNPEELIEPNFGGNVHGDVGSTVTPLVRPYIGDKTLMALQHQDEVVARRTGVSRTTMALDPESLQNQTATAAQGQRDAGYSQIELVARNMAEWGWRKVFRKLLRLMIKHQKQPRKIMTAGEEKTIDPRHWNADMDVTINVGLGTGSRERDAAMLNTVLQQQILYTDRMGSGGFPDKALEMLPYIHNTLTKFAESTGLKNPEAYWPDMDENMVEEGKQRIAQNAGKPDPKIQLEQDKAKADVETDRMKMQADAQQSQERLSLDAQKMTMEFQLRREQLVAEMELKREQLNAELGLKREQMIAELALKRELGAMGAAAKVEAATSSVNMGGDPG